LKHIVKQLIYSSKGNIDYKETERCLDR